MVATISADRVSSATVAVAITLTAALACGNVSANDVFYTANAANVLFGHFSGLTLSLDKGLSSYRIYIF